MGGARRASERGPARRDDARAAGDGLPIVYNTSSYDSLDSLRLMEGVVDVYMPDFKLWTRETARRYLKRGDYADVASLDEVLHEAGREQGWC